MRTCLPTVLTALLCGVCWWLWAGNHGLSYLLGLQDLDVQVRLLAIFIFLSLVDWVLERIKGSSGR